MGSLHKRSGSPYWWAAYRGGDNFRKFKSTKTANKEKAQAVLAAWNKAARKARHRTLTPEAAWHIIQEGVAEALEAGTGEPMVLFSVKAWCSQWMAEKAPKWEESTRTRIARAVQVFIDFIGAKANHPLALVTSMDMAAFRDHLSATRSVSYANHALFKCLTGCFSLAVRRGLIRLNPVESVDPLHNDSDYERKPYTMDEIERIIESCRGSEWEGIVLVGLYTAQRLGDVARTQWNQINLLDQTIWFIPRKTRRHTMRRIELHLKGELKTYLENLPATDDPKAFVFPKSAKIAGKATLSRQFGEILAESGFRSPMSHQSQGVGREGKRRQNEKVFHTLRHTTNNFLVELGVPEAIRFQIVGHADARTNRQYTHLSAKHTKDAIERLPAHDPPTPQMALAGFEKRRPRFAAANT